MDGAQVLGRTAGLRWDAWARWGAPDPERLTYLIDPALLGGTRWPAGRAAFRVARRTDEVLLASDGLSDPIPADAPGGSCGNGLGLEFYAVTGAAPEPLAGSWLWQLVSGLAGRAVRHGGLAELIAQQRLLSAEQVDVDVPQAHRDTLVRDGCVGVLLGATAAAPPPALPGPLGRILLVNAKLLTLAELDFATAHGDAGRTELARRFVAQGDPLASSPDRPSVV